jgi:hypothetical protein
VVFLLLYAIAIWAVAVVWRRRWQSFAAVLGSLAPVAIATHYTVVYTAGMQNGPHTWLYAVGAAYAGLIFGVGLLIAVQPRKRYAEEPCPVCEYEVKGLTGVCPECGHDLAEPAKHFRRAPKPVRVAPPDAETTEATRRRLREALDERQKEREEHDARDRGLRPPARASLDPSA